MSGNDSQKAMYLSSPITNNLQNDETWVNLVCTGEGNFLAVPLRQDFKLHFSLSAQSSIYQQKTRRKTYIFGAPMKNKFCINLVYPCFGHSRTAKLTCEGTPGCAQSQRYPASKANAAGLLCRALEKFFLLKARNSSEKPACSKWKNRQIIVAHHPSFWRK